MAGSKKKEKENYFKNAYRLGLVPVISNMYISDDHAFYHDVSKISPIVAGKHYADEDFTYGQCLIVDRNNYRYDRINLTEDLVQRTCRNLILKYNLKNL